MAGGLSGKQMAALNGGSAAEGLPLVAFIADAADVAVGSYVTIAEIKFKCRIIDVIVHCDTTDANANVMISRTRAGTTVDVLTAAIDCETQDAITRAAGLDETYTQLLAGDILKIKGDTDTPEGRVTVICVREE